MTRGHRTFHRMFGKQGGSTGTDEQFSEKSFENIGAWILGALWATASFPTLLPVMNPPCIDAMRCAPPGSGAAG